MLQIQVKKSGLNSLPGVLRFTDFGFRMMNYSYRKRATRYPARLGQHPWNPPSYSYKADDRTALAG